MHLWRLVVSSVLILPTEESLLEFLGLLKSSTVPFSRNLSFEKKKDYSGPPGEKSRLVETYSLLVFWEKSVGRIGTFPSHQGKK